MRGCSKEAKVRAYCALVRPQLEYSSVVSNPHQKSCIDGLKRVQGRAACWITAARWMKEEKRWSKSYKDLVGLNWRNNYPTYLALAELYKIVNNNSCLNFEDYYCWKPISSMRSHKWSILCL